MPARRELCQFRLAGITSPVYQPLLAISLLKIYYRLVQMKFNRFWCMPNSNTLQMEPARRLVLSYIQPNMETIDPFAKDCKIAKWRNDINPAAETEYHLDALDFLRMCQTKVAADLVIFDPPYSLRQVKECYEGFGRQFTMKDSQTACRWQAERNAINDILKVGGIVISFGWNSSGQGVGRMYEILEIMLLYHGGAHYDTIIVVEKKLAHQERLFAPAASSR